MNTEINLGKLTKERKRYLLKKAYEESNTTTPYQLKKYIGLEKSSTMNDIYESLVNIYNAISDATIQESKNISKSKREYSQELRNYKKSLMNVTVDKYFSKQPHIEDPKAFKNSIFDKKYINPKNVRKGFESLSILGYVIPDLRVKVKAFHNISVLININVLLYQDIMDQYMDFGIQMGRYNIFNIGEINKTIDEIKQRFKDRIPEIETMGTGWKFVKVLSMSVGIAKYKPHKGSSYIPLDNYLKNKKCCINIKNDDEKCLMYCVLYHLHKNVITEHPERVSKYIPFLDEFKWDSITFPVEVNKISKVEKLVGFGINVWGYDNEHSNIPFPLTKPKDGDLVMNVLLIKEGTKSHYVYISKIDTILKNNSRNELGIHASKASYACLNCCHQFSSKCLLESHKNNGCDMFEPTRVVLPNKLKNGNNPVIEFKHHTNKFKSPVVIYGDFETTIKSFKDERNGKCSKVSILEPCGYCFNVVSDFKELNLGLFLYRGENVLDHFLKALLQVGDIIMRELKKNKKMVITPEQEDAFNKCTICSICDKNILPEQIKTRDHCHITGLYRGCCHQKCNINFNYKNYEIPTFFHNLKGFDGHLIIQGLKNMNFGKVDIIAQNFEKYMTISFGNFKMLDSFAFLASSLDNLSSNLLKDGKKEFVHTLNNNKELSDDKIDLLLQKGVYPYEYMNSNERFDEEQLPPIEAFYSTLNGTGISKEEYKHAHNIWNTFKLKNMGEYHDLYLRTDVLLLTDVFETFRKTAMQSYKLDPTNGYLTLPNFAWDAMLKQTNVKLEQLTDIDMYIFCEKGIRGGISMVSHRYAKANNPYMETYDPSKDSSYIMYLDANNLYGGAMSEKLPYGNFNWRQYGIDDIINYDSDGTTGCIVECDLAYPNELHDFHNDYPLAPETREILADELSPYQLNQLKQHKETHTERLKKLVPNLYNKEKYVVHIRNLQYYIKKGMKLTKIHRVLEFAQKEWLKSYIDFNTQMRTNSKNEFEKDFYKLMNNAVFGKTMENMRTRVNIALYVNEEQANYQTAKPQYIEHKVYSENLIAIQQIKKEVELNKPIYVGQTVLDLSKLHMYKFHYEYIKPKYKEKAQLLFTDTDSLTYHIRTDDLYKDNKENSDLFDFSGYSGSGYLTNDNSNKKVIGKFKDETDGVPISEVVALRPKMYSILLDNGKEKKTGKGIKKCVLKKDVSHQDYRECLLLSNRQRQTVEFNNLRTFNHDIFTYKYVKTGLSCSENKRYLLADGIASLSYGHKNISQ